MESDRGFYSDSLTEDQAFSLWRCVGVARVILRISNPNATKEKRAERSSRWRKRQPTFLYVLCFCPSHTSHLREKLMTLTLGPPFHPACTQLWHGPCGPLPSAACSVNVAQPAADWKQWQASTRHRPLTPWAIFFLLSASSQWAGSLHQLPWQREDCSAVPRTDVTWAKMNVVGVGSKWWGRRGMEDTFGVKWSHQRE